MARCAGVMVCQSSADGQPRRLPHQMHHTGLTGGQAKELVETTCKTILGLTGDGPETKEDVPKLVKQTLVHLGLDPAAVEQSGGDVAEARALQRLLGGMSSILTGSAELRNARGTGHGKSGTPLVDGTVARLRE